MSINLVKTNKGNSPNTCQKMGEEQIFIHDASIKQFNSDLERVLTSEESQSVKYSKIRTGKPKIIKLKS